MDKRPIVFLDSGIGGIPYCREFAARNPKESLVYLADSLNFPYGGRSREELLDILGALVSELVSRDDPKMVVLACNTASVSALSFLREHFPRLVFVGTVPAVKPAVLGTKTGRVGVLGTERTVGDPYIAELAAGYGAGRRIIPVAAPELVDFVEYRYALAGEEERRRTAAAYLERFRAAGADSLVLGCTHFLFLLEEFRQAAAPDITIYESVEGITRRIESLLDEGSLRSSGGAPLRRFYVRLGGKASLPGRWEFMARGLGFELEIL
ncbi:MAG: glutamate racemase [Treponema sp.]|jgi:glutamate racemase|nr:glutamate racemase [Treponema sp.]